MRQSILHSVSEMIEIDCVKMMSLVTPLVRDAEGCAVLWSITVLANKEAIEVMQKGITLIIRKRGIDALLLFYNSMNDYVSVGSLQLPLC